MPLENSTLRPNAAAQSKSPVTNGHESSISYWAVLLRLYLRPFADCVRWTEAKTELVPEVSAPTSPPPPSSGENPGGFQSG